MELDAPIRPLSASPRLTTSNLPRGFYFAPLPPYRNEPALTSSSSIKLPILHFSRPFVNPLSALHLLHGVSAVPFFPRPYLLNSRQPEHYILLEITLAQLPLLINDTLDLIFEQEISVLSNLKIGFLSRAFLYLG